MDCSPSGSSVHGILQARILEWVAMPASRGSSPPRDRTRVSALEADALTSEPPEKSSQAYKKVEEIDLEVKCEEEIKN